MQTKKLGVKSFCLGMEVMYTALNRVPEHLFDIDINRQSYHFSFKIYLSVQRTCTILTLVICFKSEVYLTHIVWIVFG